jgi:hypothetical protein
MAKSLVTLGTAAALGAITLTTTLNPAAAQAFLAPALVGAFLGAAATSSYYGPYGYYNCYRYPYYQPLLLSALLLSALLLSTLLPGLLWMGAAMQMGTAMRLGYSAGRDRRQVSSGSNRTR